MSIKTFWEAKPIELIFRALKKIGFPLDKSYYGAIHAIKLKKISSLIPKSIQQLKHSTLSFTTNQLPPNAPIYILWWQGKDAMPPIVKLCYKSIQKNKDNHEIIFIEENNIASICKGLGQPGEKILRWYESGLISIQYLSDCLRAGLLSAKGGIWIDATVFLTKPIDEILLNKYFYSVKRLTTNLNWGFVSQNRWTSFFLSSGADNPLMKFLFSSLIECVENYNGIPDYFTIDYIIAIGYQENKEIKTFIDELPAIEPNLGLLRELNQCITEEKFCKTLQLSPLFKLDWRVPVIDGNPTGRRTIYSFLSDYKFNRL